MYNGISRSFVQGYLMGLAGVPLKTALGAALPPAADREKPAMFLYNGMGPLPALPEGYDRCPYATIVDIGDGAYWLYLSDNPFFANLYDSGTFTLANFYTGIGILFYSFLHVNGIWSGYGANILGTNRVIAGGSARGWANYDMPEENGNIYIRKSAPIPVTGGSKNPLAPSVFLSGLRFGIISRQSNALPELPDGVLISSDGYILTDYNGVYLIAAVDAEPDEPAVPDEPGEVATMYLYGTPSESGNIGLRVGESVTYYDGVVAPPLPTELKYNEDNIDFKYAIIREALVPAIAGNVYIELVNAPFQKCIYEETGAVILRPDYDVYPSYYHYGIKLNDSNVWEDMRPIPGITTNPTQYSNKGGYYISDDYRFIWTSHAILDENGEVFLEYRKPIPVSGIVEYINGIPIYAKEDS